MRVLYLVSHPIQYQAPLLRLIAAEPDIELKVLFERLPNDGPCYDHGFQADVQWDVPTTEGYNHFEVGSVSHVETKLRSADIVWVHGWDSALKRRALKSARRAGVPVLMRGENTLQAMPDGAGLRGMVKRAYLNRIFRHIGGFLCIGAENRRYYEAHGVEAARLFSMPYAVDNDFFQVRAQEAAGRREAFRAELGLDAGPPVILFAGKLHRRKHPRTLLEAFARIDPESSGRPYLVFVGDGEERAAVKAAIKADGSRVRFMGFRNQTEMPAFYDLADVFVLAGEQEPWGLAVNEAMNGSCAIVVSEACGCAADLIDPSCGRVVAPADADALAEALDNILSLPGRARAMGEAALDRISQWGFAEDLEGLRQALKAVRPGPPKA